MSVLIITDEQRGMIDAVIERAAANPVRWAEMEGKVAAGNKLVLPLKDRAPGLERPPSQHMMFGNVRVAYSHEEQPAGMFRHISASVERPGRLPHPKVMEVLCAAFHFDSFPPIEGRIWLEEFDPGHQAVNVIELIKVLQ
jgi:hypothetical protein